VSSYYCYICVLILLLCVSCVLVLLLFSVFIVLLHMCPPLLQAWPDAAQLRDVTCVPLCMGAHYYCYICVLTLMLWVCPPLLQAWADAAQLRDVTPPPPRGRMDAEYGSEHARGVAASRQ